MANIPVRELRNHTADVLRRVVAGDDVTITQNGVPVAELVPVSRPPRSPIRRNELLRMLDRLPFDSTFAADIRALTADTTADLGPLG